MDYEKLIHAIGNLRENQTAIHMEEARIALNEIINANCIDFLYTKNTDKLPFGVMVTPVLDQSTIHEILVEGSTPAINQYCVELDSKAFQYDLTDEEITSILLYDVIHMVCDDSLVDRLRGSIDSYFMSSGTQLQIKNSLQYYQILTLGLVDTLIQFTNCVYKDSDVVNDAGMISLGMQSVFTSAIAKLFNDIPGLDNSFSVPSLIVLDWCFRLYTDVEHERIPAIRQLERSRDLTGSILYQRYINRAIDSLYKIDTDNLVMESYISLNEGKKNSLFSQIRYNGLRGLEDDFYEFMVLARNAETEQEVMYALKQINVRLSILDDYLRRENLTDEDKKRWTDLYMRYRNIRDEIAQKKVYNKKNYGIFFDYNQLDDDNDD